MIFSTISSSVNCAIFKASRSASVGPNCITSFFEILCHNGKITFTPTDSRATNPSSSYWGHFLEKKFSDRMTIPKRDRVSPRSNDCRRLSPHCGANSSYQTRMLLSRSFSAKGRAISSLSSVACETKTPYSGTEDPSDIAQAVIHRSSLIAMQPVLAPSAHPRSVDQANPRTDSVRAPAPYEATPVNDEAPPSDSRSVW